MGWSLPDRDEPQLQLETAQGTKLNNGLIGLIDDPIMQVASNVDVLVAVALRAVYKYMSLLSNSCLRNKPMKHSLPC